MTQEIRSLTERHDNAVAVMTETAKLMAAEGLTETRHTELQTTFDKAAKEQENLNQILVRSLAAEKLAKEKAGEFMEVQERAADKQTDKGSDRERQEVFRRAMQFKPESLTPEERSILSEMAEKRGTSTQISGTTTLGGYMVPTLLQNEIIGLMKDYSGILQVGRIRNTSTGAQITFPKRDLTGRAAVKTAESGSIAVQDITYSQIVMDAYKYTDALKVSWELLQDSEFDILQEFREAFGESFGRAANNTLTLGDGTGDPNGVVVAAGAGLTAASATAITLGEIISLSHKVDPAYRNSPSCGYMMNDLILATIKTLSLAATNDFAGTWQPSFRDGSPSTINGFPYWINQDMVSTIATAQKTMLFGDFSKYNIRIVKDMTIMRNDFSAMSTGEVAFYAHARWDGELFDTTAVKYLVQA